MSLTDLPYATLADDPGQPEEQHRSPDVQKTPINIMLIFSSILMIVCLHLMSTPSIHPNLITFPLLVSTSSSSFTLSSTLKHIMKESPREHHSPTSDNPTQIRKDKIYLAKHKLIQGRQRWLLWLVVVSLRQSLVVGHMF